MSKFVTRNCWCKNSSLVSFTEDYSICESCHTLISQKGLSDENLQVKDDEKNFYGKNYWLQHQTDDLVQPDIIQRLRKDLPERCAYWLSFLLKYKLPPARVLEVGCAHGGFVAMMRAMGYEASGLELSPWIVDLAKKSLNIPIFTGPVETQQIEPESLDVIVLMDVVEHLPNPKATLAACVKALKQDGLLFIQMPSYPQELTYEDLEKAQHPFLSHLKIPDEHLYLFNQQSAQTLLRELGITHFIFEPAIFSHYDMFFIASATPFAPNSPDNIDSTLFASPSARFITAILDARSQIEALEKESFARFQQIEQLTTWLKEKELVSEPSHNHLLLDNIKTLEKENAAHLQQIEQLKNTLRESEHDRTERLKANQELSENIKALEKDNHARFQQIEQLKNTLKESEHDRTERLKANQELSENIKALEKDNHARFQQIEQLKNTLKESEHDRAERLKMNQELSENIKALEKENLARFQQIEQLKNTLRESEQDRAERLKANQELSENIKALEKDNHARFQQIEQLTAWLNESEQDRAERLKIIQSISGNS